MGVVGLSSVHKAHYVSALCQSLKKTALVLCQSEAQATKLCEDLSFFGSRALVFPERDFHFSSDDVCSREYEQQRLGVLEKIIGNDFDVVLCSAQAASQLTIPKKELMCRSTSIRSNDSADITELCKKLLLAGYVRSPQVDGIGQFSQRGGILDFFPPHCAQPVRLEFWGDEIDSMTFFDVESQRRTEQIESVVITPATEIIFESDEELCKKLEEYYKEIKGKGSRKSKEALQKDIDRLKDGVGLSCCDKYIGLCYDETATIFDYLDESLLFVSESKSVRQDFEAFTKTNLEDIKLMLEEGTLVKGLDSFNLSWQSLLSVFESMGAIYLDNFTRGSFDTPVRSLVSVNAGTNASWNGTLSFLSDDLLPLLKNSYACVVLAGTVKNAKEIALELESAGFDGRFFDSIPERFESGTVSVLPGTLSSGFEYDGLKFSLVSYKKGSAAKEKRQVKKSKKPAKSLLSIEEISRGDYVVHASYGIGIFDGIKTMTVDGKVKDFIKINFKGSDILYLPVTQLDLLSKYISPKDTDKPVKLNRLGGDEWNKTKKKVRSAVADIAKQLSKIYSARLNTPGFAFSPDTDMQSDFERRFEFDETDDQLTAINEIKNDMEKTYPMDRLLCGDVGFGKTEVALRAAFKCIADGKQCAILVPTTILAFQHYQTIKKRFDGFPVEIEMLSRFRTTSERTKIKKGLKRGSIDLVVGTHSIISAGVEFKDLGLLIVDEEQRFGVAQKEKLKERFPLVDVLTLSATPIPRTLNMAMSGIRDMSVLEIPPLDRHPVQTYVLEYDLDVLCEAMRREIRRGGQVYYLHNRVDSIEQTASKISQKLPEARIGIGHGKMSEEELSEVWRKLIEGEIDILICTTIIETGVDVPNANTLIIEDANRLGLAQLHQIRGRVGRSARRAFAYFTFSPNRELSEIAQRRLGAIREFTQFGSGFQIALRDLEIRGAGNILGSAQHGHMEAVGYDMYLQMLSEAIEKRNELGADSESEAIVEEKKECVIDIAVDAHIPEKYIPSVRSRISMYKRIASITCQDDALDVIDEFIDRFGDPPTSVKGLIEVALIRNRAAAVGIYEVKQRTDSIVIYINDIKPEYITLLQKYFRRRVMIGVERGKQSVTIKLMGHTPVRTLSDAVKVFEMYKGGESNDIDS